MSADLDRALGCLARAEQLAGLDETSRDLEVASAATLEAALAVVRSGDVVRGLEALVLVTAAPWQASKALDAGAATVVQDALETSNDDDRVAELAKTLGERLLGAQQPSEEEATVEQRPVVFGQYTISEGNADKLHDIFPKKETKKSTKKQHELPVLTTGQDFVESLLQEKPKKSGRRKKTPRQQELTLMDRIAQFGRIEEERQRRPKSKTKRRKKPTTTTTKKEEPPQENWSTADLGGPYEDVDAELFASAHAMGPDDERPKPVRILEGLFAPRRGAPDVEGQRYRSALEHARTQSHKGRRRRRTAQHHTQDDEDDEMARQAEELSRSIFASSSLPTLMSGPSPAPMTTHQPKDAVDPYVLWEVYRLFDVNNRGLVEPKVFKTCIKCAAGDTISEVDLEMLTKRYENEDGVDYEMFCSSGKIGRAFGESQKNPLTLPALPWIEQQHHADKKDDSRGKSWDAHVRRVKEQRSGAYAYLVRRGLKGIRHTRATLASKQFLRVAAIRAVARDALRQYAIEASRHDRTRQDAMAWLSERVTKVRYHQEKRDQTARYLRTKFAAKAKAAVSFKALAITNIYVAYERKFYRDRAVAYLADFRGRLALARKPRLEDAVAKLHQIGIAALATATVQNEARNRLRYRGRCGVRALERRGVTFEELRRLGQRTRQRCKLRFETVDALRQLATTVRKHQRTQFETHLLLTALGQAGLQRKFRRVFACDALIAVGVAARAHGVRTTKARNYLRRRVAVLGKVDDIRFANFDVLRKIGNRAKKTATAMAAARDWLKREVATVRSSQWRRDRARTELRSLVNIARDAVLGKELAIQYKKRYTVLLKSETALDDEERAAEATEHRDAVARRVFREFDGDKSGMLDKVEFEAMTKSGRLLGLASRPRRSVLSDAFEQMDNDSGHISEPEFLAWFRHVSNGPALFADVVPAKDRALRRLVAEFHAGELKEEDKTRRPSTSPGKKPPKKEIAAINDDKTTQRVLMQRTFSAGSVLKKQKEPVSTAPLMEALDFQMPKSDEDEGFAAEFLGRARRVFDLVDANETGTLTGDEFRKALSQHQAIRDFFMECTATPDLQALLSPTATESAVACFDTNDDGKISLTEWAAAVEKALVGQLAVREQDRSEEDKLTEQLRSRGMMVFELVSEHGGSLHAACSEEPVVASFIAEHNFSDDTCTKEAWSALVEEAVERELASLRSTRAEDRTFATSFRLLAREIFYLADADDDYCLTASELRAAVAKNPKIRGFFEKCGNVDLTNLLDDSGAIAASLDRNGDGNIDVPEWKAAVEKALQAKLMARVALRKRAKDQRINDALTKLLPAAGEDLILRDTADDDVPPAPDDNGDLRPAAYKDDPPPKNRTSPRRRDVIDEARPKSPAGLPVSDRPSRLCAVM